MLAYEWGMHLVPRLLLAKRQQMLAASAPSFQGTHDLHTAWVGDGLDATDAFLRDVVEHRAPLLN